MSETEEKKERVRKVFLDDLPKKRRGINEVIDWKSSVGCKVRFIYDDVEGEVEIIGYLKEKHHILIKYNNKVFSIHTGNFIKVCFGNLLGLINFDYKYNIGDIITTNKSNLVIIKHVRTCNHNKAYEYKCLKCNQVEIMNEYDLIKGRGCPYCCDTPRKILKGYNDIFTTDYNVARLLKNESDMYKYSIGHSNKLAFTCPDCSNVVFKKTYEVKRRGICCHKCSDGVSYPEKFIWNVLEQLDVKFEKEYSPNWADGKKYDFYISSINCIIEVHGLQHYGKGFENIGKNARTLEDERQNDFNKKKRCLNNGVKDYIVIDARKSDLEYIKKNVSNSKLGSLYNLSNIDWVKCEGFALSSLIKTACDYWESGIKSTKKISNIMKINYNTVNRYLKKGVKHGWCSYNPELSRKINKTKSVVCLTTNEVFDSMKNAREKYNICKSSITKCCQDKQKSAGKHPTTGEPLKWMYYEDYIEKYGEEGLIYVDEEDINTENNEYQIIP